MQSLSLIRNLIAALLLTCAAALGVLGQGAIDNGPTREQLTAFERATLEWSYIFEARNIGYLNNKDDYEAFVVMQIFRGNGIPDTIYFYDERENFNSGFACMTGVENRAQSGLFIVKQYASKPILKNVGTTVELNVVEKLDYYCLQYFMEEWPIDAKHNAVRSWNKSFKTYDKFHEWLFSLPKVNSIEHGSWKMPSPNNRLYGHSLTDICMNQFTYAKERGMGYDSAVAISDSIYLFWDSVMQKYFSESYLNRTFRNEMFYDRKSRLWPEVFPPKDMDRIKYSEAEKDSIRKSNIQKMIDRDRAAYDSLVKIYPNDSIKLKQMYRNDSLWQKRTKRSHGSASKPAGDLARPLTLRGLWRKDDEGRLPALVQNLHQISPVSAFDEGLRDAL